MKRILLSAGIALFVLSSLAHAKSPCSDQWLPREEFAKLEAKAQSDELNRLAGDLKNGCPAALSGLGYLTVRVPENDQLRWLSLLITVSELQSRQLSVQSALVDQFLAKIKTLTASVEEAKTKIAELEKLEGQLGALASERDRLESLLQIRDAELGKIRVEKSAIALDRNQFQELLTTAERTAAVKDQAYEDLSQQSAHFEALYGEKKAELEKNLAKLNQLVKKLNLLSEQMAASEEAVKARNQVIENLNVRVSNLEQLNANKDLVVQESRNNLEAIKKSILVAEQKLEAEKKQASYLLAKKQALTEELEQVRSELKLFQLNSENLEFARAALSEQLDERKRAYDLLAKQERELARLLADLNEKNHDLIEANAVLEQAIVDSENREADLSAQVAEKATGLEVLSAENSELREKLRISAERIVAMQAEIMSLGGEYNEANSQLERLKLERDTAIVARSELEAQLQKLKLELRDREVQLEEQIKQLKADVARLEKRNENLASATAELERVKQKLAKKTAQLERAIQEKTAQSERDKQKYADLVARLAADQEKIRQLKKFQSDFYGALSKALEGRSDIRSVGDRFVFQSEVLFGSGSAQLSDDGRVQIEEVARVLQNLATEIPGGLKWVLQVNGHTDAQQLKPGGRFADNWELSTARALSVVRVMQDYGVDPEHLSAAGYGEFQPVVVGATSDELARNRRIELKLTD